MSGDSLAAALSRLHNCQEAADLIYSKDAARLLAAAPAHPTDAFTGATTATPTTQPGNTPDEFSIVIARRIATMVARLNDLASPASQVVLTPRMVLCELMDVLRQGIYTSLPPSMQQDVNPTDKAAVVRQFNAYASSRQIPLEAAAEGLYVVSYVSVKLRVELVALQLRRRIHEELQRKDAQSSEASVAALVITETLLDDLMTVYDNIVLTLPITKAANSNSSHHQVGDSAEAQAAAQRLVPVFAQYFYQLCDWILVLESTMQGPVFAYTQVKRLSVDEQRGVAIVELHRPTPQTAWGLLLNEQGSLVDIDVSLRVFEKAKQLHELLQAAPQGATITKINDTVIPPVRQGNYAAYAQKLMTVLQTTTAQRKNVQLTMQSSAFKAAARTLPTEVAFVAPPQGGEGTSGQRVTLVLRRQSASAEWGFTVDEQLYWRPPDSRVLSSAAKTFMKSYGRHLRLLAVNGVEALHVTQVELLVAAAETVVLELLVMPTFANGRRGVGAPKATDETTEPTAKQQQPRQAHLVSRKQQGELKDEETSGDRSARKTNASSKKATELTDAKLEAAVAKLLQDYEEKESEAVQAGAAVEGKDTVALETPLVDVVATTPSAGAAAAVTAAVEAKTKRGRQRKAAAAAAANEDGKAVETPSAQLTETKAAAPVAVEAEMEQQPAKAEGIAEAEKEKGKVPNTRRGRSRKANTLKATDAAAAASAPLPVSTTAIDVNDSAVQKILAAFSDADTTTAKGEPRSRATASEAKKDEVEAADAGCVFDNKVRLVSLSPEEMVLERPSAEVPWGLPIGRMADTADVPQHLPLRLMSLPPAKATAVKKHPFLAEFKKDPTTWYIAEVNGKAASNAEATLKSIGKLTRMTLRFLRK